MSRKNVMLLSISTTLLMLAVILVSHFRTSQNTQIVGGPCSYDNSYHPVIIKKIIPYGNSSYNMELYNYGHAMTDTLLNYYLLNNSYLESERLGDLQVGDTITLVESNITNGSCTPRLFYIEVTLFKNNKSN